MFLSLSVGGCCSRSALDNAVIVLLGLPWRLGESVQPSIHFVLCICTQDIVSFGYDDFEAMPLVFADGVDLYGVGDMVQGNDSVRGVLLIITTTTTIQRIIFSTHDYSIVFRPFLGHLTFSFS